MEIQTLSTPAIHPNILKTKSWVQEIRWQPTPNSLHHEAAGVASRPTISHLIERLPEGCCQKWSVNSHHQHGIWHVKSGIAREMFDKNSIAQIDGSNLPYSAVIVKINIPRAIERVHKPTSRGVSAALLLLWKAPYIPCPNCDDRAEAFKNKVEKKSWFYVRLSTSCMVWKKILRISLGVGWAQIRGWQIPEVTNLEGTWPWGILTWAIQL